MQSSDQSNIQLEEVLFGLASLSSDQSNIQLEEVLFGLASLFYCPPLSFQLNVNIKQVLLYCLLLLRNGHTVVSAYTP
jgi:hypothetical protein